MISIFFQFWNLIGLFIWNVYGLLTYTVTATITLDLWAIMLVSMLGTVISLIIIRYRFLDRYSRLKDTASQPTKQEKLPFDLHPSVAIDDMSDRDAGFADDFMNAFLSSIKIFGYLDRPVFHELARHLQTRKLHEGDILFDENTNDQDFYVVVNGKVQLFVKGNSDSDIFQNSQDIQDDVSRTSISNPLHTNSGPNFFVDDDFSPVPGFHLLNEVTSGGTVSSLFTILSVFTEDIELPKHPGAQNQPSHEYHDDQEPETRNDEEDTKKEDHFDDQKSELKPNMQHSDEATVDNSGNQSDQQSEDYSPAGRGEPVFPSLKRNDSPSTANIDHTPLLPFHEISISQIQSRHPPIIAPPVSQKFKQGTHSSQYPKKKVPKSSENTRIQAKNKRSVHPQMLARAAEETTLAVIPAAAFRKLTNKFPNAAAHIAQVILTRFQRLTFLTLNRYLGLSKELLNIEQHVNEFNGFGLPTDLFPPAAVHALRFGDLYRPDNAGTPLNSSKTGRGKKDGLGTPPMQRLRSNASWVDDDVEEQMRDAVFQCFAQVLGMTPQENLSPVSLEPSTIPAPGSSSLSPLNLATPASQTDSPKSVPEFLTRRTGGAQTGLGGSHLSGGYRAERLSFLKGPRRGSVNSTPGSAPGSARAPLAGRRSYMDDDLESSFSRVSSQLSEPDVDETVDESDISICNFSTGHVLIREGERNAGIYFVIDGILEASIQHTSLSWSSTDLNDEFDKPSFDRESPPSTPKTRKRRSLFFIRPGGLAGYLSSLTGNSSFVNIVAKTDVIVGFMPKAAVDRYVEKYPSVLLYLAKRLVSHLSPLVFQIDVALEWGQINAGQILCRQEEPSTAIYIVLTGRLRSVVERNQNGQTRVDVLGEFGQSESVGELEVLMDLPRPGTIHAIRDTEVAIMPKTLFNLLSLRHPEITLSISRIIAARAAKASSHKDSPRNPILGETWGNRNLKTVAILPVNGYVPVGEFSDRLREAVQMIGGSVALLNTSGVTGQLGKHAFTRLGRLKLLSWLAEQEEIHRLVLYVADGGVTSPWTQRCIRQADCVLLVGLGDHDPEIGEYERLLTTMKTTARKELILLHSERYVIPGSTAQWLKPRPWVQAHHHVQMNVSAPGLPIPSSSNANRHTLTNLRHHFEQYYNRLYPAFAKKSNRPTIFTGVRSDFARLARRLLSKSIGLVLGGGGARGISHVGVIRALEEAGVPIDMVGGTSIGAFVGGLFARENDHVSVFGRCKMLSGRIVSTWRSLLDLTYPVVALFTGHEFNRGIFKCFSDTQIEDCWISYFAVTTNITWSRMEIHQQGYMWRYVRASMSLAGFLPPLCDNGNMLLDGGYMNNLPADVMRSLGAQTIIAVDVGSVDDTSPVTYGDSLSGWWLIFRRFNPFRRNYGPIPTSSEVQDRLAYVSSVKQLEEAKALEGCLYLHPPVASFAVMEFGKFSEIFGVGYEYGKQFVEQWQRDGTLWHRFGVMSDDCLPEKRSLYTRRASI